MRMWSWRSVGVEGSPRLLWEPQCAVLMGEVEEAGVPSLAAEGEIHTPEGERGSLSWTGDIDLASPGEPEAD